MPASVYVIGTMDTKAAEVSFVAQQLRDAKIPVKTIDVSTGDAVANEVATWATDVQRTEILGADHPPISGQSRAQAIAEMSHKLTAWLVEKTEEHQVLGVLGLGGSGGTSLISQAMRALPIGVPKVMVSTMASGNTQPFVDCSDITMMYSVVDIAGLNNVSRRVLANAAHAMKGMVTQTRASDVEQTALGMTMFGVTTPCVMAVKQQLEQQGFECLVFHATGTGGRAMEQLVDSGLIQGVLDITTTEVADKIAGGIMPAGDNRFDSLLKREIPLVLSVGAVDMVNFGGRETVPDHYRNRQLFSHNEQITLMRTSVEENRAIAAWIATKLNQSTSPLRMVLPMGGVSALDAPGEAFWNPAADAALFSELEERFNETAERRLIRSPHHINSPEFGAELIKQFSELTATSL